MSIKIIKKEPTKVIDVPKTVTEICKHTLYNYKDIVYSVLGFGTSVPSSKKVIICVQMFTNDKSVYLVEYQEFLKNCKKHE